MNINEIKNPDLQSKEWPAPVKRGKWKEVWSKFKKKGVLFDLDGTLLDTAGDLGAAANSLRDDLKLPPLPIEKLRPHTSRGARGMIETALGITWDDPKYEILRIKFLERYENCLTKTTEFMPGMESLLHKLGEKNISWGIVTNKHERYTMPIVKNFDLLNECSTIVCGDTLSYCKPHPAPVLHAIREINIKPQGVIYIGDDPRDIQSGFNAGCWTLAVAFDTYVEKEIAKTWGGDETATNCQEILSFLDL